MYDFEPYEVPCFHFRAYSCHKLRKTKVGSPTHYKITQIVLIKGSRSVHLRNLYAMPLFTREQKGCNLAMLLRGKILVVAKMGNHKKQSFPALR